MNRLFAFVLGLALAFGVRTAWTAVVTHGADLASGDIGPALLDPADNQIRYSHQRPTTLITTNTVTFVGGDIVDLSGDLGGGGPLTAHGANGIYFSGTATNTETATLTDTSTAIGTFTGTGTVSGSATVTASGTASGTSLASSAGNGYTWTHTAAGLGTTSTTATATFTGAAGGRTSTQTYTSIYTQTTTITQTVAGTGTITSTTSVTGTASVTRTLTGTLTTVGSSTGTLAVPLPQHTYTFCWTKTNSSVTTGTVTETTSFTGTVTNASSTTTSTATAASVTASSTATGTGTGHPTSTHTETSTSTATATATTTDLRYETTILAPSADYPGGDRFLLGDNGDCERGSIFSPYPTGTCQYDNTGYTPTPSTPVTMMNNSTGWTVIVKGAGGPPAIRWIMPGIVRYYFWARASTAAQIKLYLATCDAGTFVSESSIAPTTTVDITSASWSYYTATATISTGVQLASGKALCFSMAAYTASGTPTVDAATGVAHEFRINGPWIAGELL